MATDPARLSDVREFVPPAWRDQPPARAEDSPNPPDPAPATPASLPAERTLSPVETTAALLRGRFAALVLWHLFFEGKRFYQLVRELPGVPRKALAHQLEELERQGIVVRRQRLGRPAKVEYRLTPLGERLKIVVGAMYEWGLLARRTETLAGSPPFPDEGAAS